MGVAIDTVGFFATNPGAAGIAATLATGDSSTVRNFGQQDNALLLGMFRQGATSGFVRARSPLLHDFVRGIMFTPSETPAAVLVPRRLNQRFKPQDVLTIEIGGGAAEVDAGALSIYYTNLPGASARLHMWSDLANLIKNVKPVEIDFNTAATAGQWQDTVLTTTENLLHANTDYACIGYLVDVAVDVFGLRGIDTSNLRICGPGALRSEVTTDWFAKLSDDTGLATIPVINSANVGGLFASCQAVATGAAIKGQLILAELAQSVTP
jgi:hypothetical protein